jgi:hypothetical protein
MSNRLVCKEVQNAARQVLILTFSLTKELIVLKEILEVVSLDMG